MSKETLIDELTRYGNSLICDTSAMEYYEDYLEKYPTGLEELDRIHDVEINSLLVKCFQTFTAGECVLDQASPLLQALVYRRLKVILDHYGDKNNKPISRGRSTLLHALLVEWHFLNIFAARSEQAQASQE